MKSFLTIILLIVSSLNCKAQFLNDYGIKLGAGISNQSWDYSAGFNLSWDYKIGISARAFADFFNWDYFQLEGETGTILIEYRYERDFADNHGSPYIVAKNYSHVILLGIMI